MTDAEMIHCPENDRQINRLRAIMHRLRAPGGCPWDAEQTHESLVPNLIEAYAWLALAAEWQRDWARTDHAAGLTEVLKQHAAGSGIAYLWEQQLLNTPVPPKGGYIEADRAEIV